MYESVSFSLLKTVLTSAHGLELLSGESTHDPALRLVGQLARQTDSDRLIIAIVEALLPEGYSGNTLSELPKMITSARKKGFNNSQESKRKRQASESASSTALNLAKAAGIEAFRNQFGDACLSVRHNGATFTYLLRGSDAAAWLRNNYYQSTGRPLTQHATAELIQTLEAIAFQKDKQRTSVRLGEGSDGSIYVDLGTITGEVVRIAVEGWSVVAQSPVKFLRPPSFESLPYPSREGRVEDLKQLLRLSDSTWTLVFAFILNCFQPRGPFICLLVSADQGAGKSFLTATIKRIVDPTAVARPMMARNEHELMIHASQNALLVFDNVSQVKWDMSDALSTLATGGGFMVRRLYTDNESRLFSGARPFILNGIGNFADRPDLMDRAIHIRLQGIQDEQRRSEREMTTDLDTIVPGVLGAIYDIVVGALRELPATNAPTELRMADAARWLTACEQTAGLRPGTFVTALRENQIEMMVQRAADDPLLSLLLETVKSAQSKAFDGTIGELHSELLPRVSDYRPSWFPKTPASLSNMLARLRPAAAKIGITIEMLKRTRRGSHVRVSLDAEAASEAPGNFRERDGFGRPNI